jgi:hypothetical protein
MLARTRDGKRAFHKLGRIMSLGPIDRIPYLDFIHGWLRKGGYRVDKSDLERIFELEGMCPPQHTETVPYHVGTGP